MEVPTTQTNNNIDKLYELVINSSNTHQTFLDNLELWKDFYANRNEIISQNILNKKLFPILKFLLLEEYGEIFDYFHSNIIESLSRYQQNFPQLIMCNKREKNIDELLTNLDLYQDFVNFLKENNIETAFQDTKRYLANQTEEGTVQALIVTLHEQFFILAPNIIKKTIEFIHKSPVFNKINPSKQTYIHADMIQQYQKRLLPLTEFLGQNLKGDPTIQKLKNGEIQDKNIIKALFKNLSKEKILSIFDYNLQDLVSFLEHTTCLDEVEQYSIFLTLSDNLLSEDEGATYLLSLITNPSKDFLTSTYLTDKKRNEILTKVNGMSPMDLDIQDIHYLLKEEYYHLDLLFLKNLMHYIHQNKELKPEEKEQINSEINTILKMYSYKDLETLNKEEIKQEDPITEKTTKSEKYELTGKLITFEDAIELLQSYLKEEVILDTDTLKQIVKSIGINSLESLDVPINGIYFVDAKDYNGCYSPETDSININNFSIQKLKNKKSSLYNRLSIFKTLFHEMRHAMVGKALRDKNYDIETYKIAQEDILRAYEKDFYTKNYSKISMELDARLSGIDMLAKFLETYLPEFLDTIQNEMLKDLEQEKQQLTNNDEIKILEIFEKDFHHVFDTLIKYNPSLLEKHPIFNLEYHQDGTPKTYEEMIIQCNEENYIFVQQLIQRRYPTQFLQEQHEIYEAKKIK